MVHKTVPKSEFSIVSPRTRQDNIGIGQAQLQSWIETYPNQELGIDEEWIHSEVGHLVKKRGIDFREKQIELALESDANILYKIAKDKTGKIYGFLHVSKDETSAKLDAIYLIKDAQGSGVANELMHYALDFIGNLPANLEVAAYNERAIRFYERHGFTKRTVNKELHRGKIPILNMHRKGETQ